MAARPDIYRGPGETAPASTQPAKTGSPAAGRAEAAPAEGGPATTSPSTTAQATTAAFRTIGCKLNQCETAQMQETLLAQGYRLVDWSAAADIRVVNTCTVTVKSDSKCRHEIRMAKRLDPASTIVVTGCYAQVDPCAVAAIPGVDLVLGNLDKLHLAERLAELSPQDEERRACRAGSGADRDAISEAAASPSDPHTADEATAAAARTSAALFVSAYPEHPQFEGEFFSHFYGYTRAFLKVQTGCDSHCAYCIIPQARGPARSMPLADVLRELDLLAARGFREVVLTGINLGSWGRDTSEGTVPDMLEALLEHNVSAGSERGGGTRRGSGADATRVGKPPGAIGRYRLSSIEPLEVDQALMDVIEAAGDRMARHFHLPLQSGSDSVLRRMDRPYVAYEYLAVIAELARRFPDAAIGADVIVGFPGETEAQFAETLAFVERSPLTYLHVFAYSDRPGTKASAMRPKVSPETIHRRSVRLRALGELKNAAFRSTLRGTEQRVLVLQERDAAGRLVGITGNYMEVLLDGDESLVNRFVRVRLNEVGTDGRWTVTLLSVEGSTDADATPGGAAGSAAAAATGTTAGAPARHGKSAPDKELAP